MMLFTCSILMYMLHGYIIFGWLRIRGVWYKIIVYILKNKLNINFKYFTKMIDALLDCVDFDIKKTSNAIWISK